MHLAEIIGDKHICVHYYTYTDDVAGLLCSHILTIFYQGMIQPPPGPVYMVCSLTVRKTAIFLLLGRFSRTDLIRMPTSVESQLQM